jgi:hypothetical protein
MSNEVTNDTVVGNQTQACVVEVAAPSSLSPSDTLLSRIATLLFLLVAGMLTVFGYYASGQPMPSGAPKKAKPMQISCA